MPRDARTLSWIALLAVAGWLLHQWIAGFAAYAIGVALLGVIGTLGTGSIFAAPLGVGVGKVVGMVTTPPDENLLEIFVALATLSIAVLTGLFARGLRRAGAREP